MLEHDKPGYVLFKEWKNFGENKTYLLQQAYGKNFSQGARYLMWLDTDETFLPRRAADAYEKTNDPKALLTYATLEDREKLLTFADHSLRRLTMESLCFRLSTASLNVIRDGRWPETTSNTPGSFRLMRSLSRRKVLLPVRRTMRESSILARKEGDGPKEGVSRNTTYIRWFKEWEATHEKTNRYYARNLFYLAQALEESGNLPEGIRYYKERLNYEGSYQEKYIARLRFPESTRMSRRLMRRSVLPRRPRRWYPIVWRRTWNTCIALIRRKSSRRLILWVSADCSTVD